MEAPAPTSLGPNRIHLHEWLYLALGLLLLLAALVHNAGSPVVWGLAVGLLVYSSVLTFSPPGGRVRLLASFAATWALYTGSSAIIEALHLSIRSADLLAVDVRTLGSTPAVSWQHLAPWWLLEVFSAAYLNYQLYVHWALIQAWWTPEAERAAFARRVFTTFAVGFAGYFLIPAATPASAFPKLFTAPLTAGPVTAFNEALNQAAAARYDAFPSLHVVITLTLLAWDWTHHRTRFWIMLAPGLLMIVGTMFLRFHYAVDVACSVLLFALLQAAFHRMRSR